MVWSAALIAAPPEDMPQTAADIERALSAPENAQQPALQLRGGPVTGNSNIGRVRGLGAIVDDPSQPSAQSPAERQPASQATPSQVGSTQAAPSRIAPPQDTDGQATPPRVAPAQVVVTPQAVARVNYTVLIRDRPKSVALIHFDSNSARIRSDAYPLLNEYATALKSDKLSSAILVIAGHTDDVGSAQYNLRLSQQRAQSVKDYLVARGIADQRLIVRGFGEAYPVASNATESGREMNRRSEFIRIDAPPSAVQ
ncbi:MAG: OmpA family protein [Gammaproteobacteria bacterium]|nr:OmpA family protein [Gammaproteobacteria bacterium]